MVYSFLTIEPLAVKRDEQRYNIRLPFDFFFDEIVGPEVWEFTTAITIYSSWLVYSLLYD
jgi:hypothetical protein